MAHDRANPSVHPFPVVGIGASAGGLAAFESFFAGLGGNASPGMAFVLVQHLAPDHKSLLRELVAGFTPMQVLEIEDGMELQANSVYILPPNYDLDFFDGALRLLAPGAPHGQRLPIDYFFASLALELGPRAVGIVLAGTGADGSQGLCAIKGAGGMVMAQDPAPLEFEGMPQSAIATGLVDFQLAPADMAPQLLTYWEHKDKGPSLSQGIHAKHSGPWLRQALALLQAETGHDFSHYKPSTIHRRIERRMAVHQIDTLQAFVELLKREPHELRALLQDLLIGVTHFFRDAEAFEYLETQVVPGLFEGKTSGAAVRVWCAACSTGQEAYSVAILLVERMDALKKNLALQVFATDIDSRAIAIARLGVYPLSIAADIAPERLVRFFTLEPGGQSYRIHKRIRDVLVFSEQDVIKDPPFSKLDLICCRNLLIYLDTFLQKKLIPLFHYALLPGGTLFLGSSEGIGEFDKLFVVRDRSAKVYQRKPDGHGVQTLALTPATESSTGPVVARLRPSAAVKPAAKLPLRTVMEQALLRHVTPSSVLVNGSGDVLYVHGHTGLFLEPSQGEVGVQNILKMAHTDLRSTLSMALRQVQKNGHVFKSRQVKGVVQGLSRYVDITVQRLARNHADASETPLFLVTLDERPAPPSALTPEPSNSESDTTSIQSLTQALREKDEYLQSTQEALEGANEELQSSVEEMQSVNDELQSANEELETSKEELQSVNEELATVNTELQTKVNDLSRSNNDMNNLLAGTGVGTVFVDMHLKILRFTPAVAAIMNLIPSDLGRSVSHIASNLVNYTRLVADVKAVLHSLEPKALEVQTSEDTWYTLHIQPYRTLSNVVEGAVISFENITEMVRARAALEKANDLLRLAVVDAQGAVRGS